MILFWVIIRALPQQVLSVQQVAINANLKLTVLPAKLDFSSSITFVVFLVLKDLQQTAKR